jgi:hypothetical protein
MNYKIHAFLVNSSLNYLINYYLINQSVMRFYLNMILPYVLFMIMYVIIMFWPCI